MKDYTASAKHSLSMEITGLQSILEKSVDDTFNLVVKTILKTKGRVVLSGMGKPGYIAHKTAATLASTGTPAIFIHPAESSHGDLGMIAKGDTVILLSNMGGSRELNDIIAYCKRFGITLIGVTRKANSTLGESADIRVVLENIPETNAVGSPTTSMVMMLAYMDAVATALINARGFNEENYKIFHPGGKLGAALIKVDEIMHMGNEIPLIRLGDTMAEALDEMIAKSLGCVGILDDGDKLVGIITDGDLKRRLKEYNCNLMEMKVSDVMTPNPIAIRKNSLALEAVKIMNIGVGANNNYIQVLFVVDSDDRVVGILHIQDCFRAGVI